MTVIVPVSAKHRDYDTYWPYILVKVTRRRGGGEEEEEQEVQVAYVLTQKGPLGKQQILRKALGDRRAQVRCTLDISVSPSSTLTFKHFPGVFVRLQTTTYSLPSLGATLHV